MARLGFFSLPWPGHLNPMGCLAREMERRGHTAVFFQLPRFGPAVRRRGLAFQAYGATQRNSDRLPGYFEELSRQRGGDATSSALEILTLLAEALFSSGEGVIAEADLDLWVVDQMDYAAATLAAKMGAPFVTAVVTLLKQEEEGIPGFDGSPYRKGELKEMGRRVQPFLQKLEAYRREAGLEPFSYSTLWSDLAQISQQPAEFEFPRSDLPRCFHFTGPFARDEQREPVPFPWERLDDRPLVYASFGTLQYRQQGLRELVLRATRDLGVQLVLSLGGESQARLDSFEHAVVVPYAPQLELLRRASAAIVHAGMNSTLECLTAGVPMVALPLAHDQPGVAARIAWSGTGLSLSPDRVDESSLRQALGRLLGEASFRRRAEEFQELIRNRDGLSQAADIIERVVGTGRPVYREP